MISPATKRDGLAQCIRRTKPAREIQMMTATEMDTDLAKYFDAEIMSHRLGYWERRMKLARLADDEFAACQQVAIKHASRIARLMRAG